VPDDDMSALMTAAASVAYVSTYEGYGLPVIEAMACGAVVVTSNVSSMPEVAGGEGILVDPFSTSSIAAGLAESLVANDADRARAIARAARESWQQVAEQTASVWDRLA
jgi:glycosyltransferase involved in cell wall biosynthesis